MFSFVWLCGFFVAEWPRAAIDTPVGQRFFSVVAAIAICIVATAFTRISMANYRLKTIPMGRGGDEIRGFGLDVFVCHDNLEAARVFLESRLHHDSTLLVAPEGIMLNYWTRTKTPLRITNLLPPTLALNGHDVVEDLGKNPPDYVMIATRTVADDRYPPFGTDDQSGRNILLWIDQNYVKEARAGKDPLRSFSENEFGLWILKRKTAWH
jgi:hypothetical protein